MSARFLEANRQAVTLVTRAKSRVPWPPYGTPNERLSDLDASACRLVDVGTSRHADTGQKGGGSSSGSACGGGAGAGGAGGRGRRPGGRGVRVIPVGGGTCSVPSGAITTASPGRRSSPGDETGTDNRGSRRRWRRRRRAESRGPDRPSRRVARSWGTGSAGRAA